MAVTGIFGEVLDSMDVPHPLALLCVVCLAYAHPRPTHPPTHPQHLPCRRPAPQA
jgi:hypothetical protein